MWHLSLTYVFTITISIYEKKSLKRLKIIFMNDVIVLFNMNANEVSEVHTSHSDILHLSIPSFGESF